jgi:ankyrin repeat protein
VDQCSADVEAKVGGSTALHAASLCGKLDVVKYLVEQCLTNVDTQNSDGKTAQQVATDEVGVYLQRMAITFKMSENSETNETTATKPNEGTRS